MARTSTYLNFPRATEAAFNFYSNVFGTEFEADFARMGDVPAQDGMPPMAEEDKNLDTRTEAHQLFSALSDGGTIGMDLQPMFWGALFGSLTDKFGTSWMVNCATTE